MSDKKIPDPNKIFPFEGVDTLTYIKPTIKNPNVIVGDFSYYSGVDFEKQIIHHYDFINDKLIIGKFCQIACGVTFIMNGANHQMNAVTTYPFYVLEGWVHEQPPLSEMGVRGDTVIGNDVWIGQNATILSGVTIGDGAIIGLNSTVTKNIPPYCVAVGNPAKVVHKRFDDELIEIILKLKWWDRSSDEINDLIPILTSGDLKYVKDELLKIINR